jgi:hypothetical protein
MTVSQKEHVANNPARAYILRVLDELGTDATNLARKAKINPSTITGFLSKTPRVRTVRPATLEAIARVSNIPLPGELLASMSDTSSTRHSADGMPRDVPVHGLISSPVQDAYYWNTTAADFAPRPFGIQHNRRVFALRMPDDSMDGWRRVNELVYIDPMRAVAERDHAMVELANTPAPNDLSVYMIRRVLRRRPNGVVLGTWGISPASVEMPRTGVLSFLRVLEWPEVVGV